MITIRKEASKAVWVEELGMAEVLEKKGKMWVTTGIVRDGKLYCSMEETLYVWPLHLSSATILCSLKYSDFTCVSNHFYSLVYYHLERAISI